MAFKKCKVCSGRGILNWSSKYVSQRARSGSIQDLSVSVCGVCDGCGIEYPRKYNLESFDMSPEEYEEAWRKSKEAQGKNSEGQRAGPDRVSQTIEGYSEKEAQVQT